MTYDDWKTTEPALDGEPCSSCGRWDCACEEEQTRDEREEKTMSDALTETLDNLRSTFGLRTPEQLAEDAIVIAHKIAGAAESLIALRRELEAVRGSVADSVVGPDEQPWKVALVEACVGQLAQLDSAIAAFGVKQ